MVGMSGHSYHCTDAAPDKVQHGTDKLGEAGPQRCRLALLPLLEPGLDDRLPTELRVRDIDDAWHVSTSSHCIPTRMCGCMWPTGGMHRSIHAAMTTYRIAPAQLGNTVGGASTPARETVAGDALFKFSGSKMAFIWGVISMRSPFASVSTCHNTHRPAHTGSPNLLAHAVLGCPTACL